MNNNCVFMLFNLKLNAVDIYLNVFYVSKHSRNSILKCQ